LPEEVFHWREIAIVLAVAAGIAGISAIYPLLLQLEGVFFRIGILVFGNGFTMIPLIQQQVVNVYHWLNLDQFTAGIALGQITPGPVVITATFVGYKVAGILGALAATIGIFAPCFILVTLVMPIYKKIKENPWVKAIFKGIVASFIGLMLVVVVGMGRHSLSDYTTAALSVATLAVLRFTKIDVLWVVLGGTAIYLLLATAFGL
jgi:chromate transporter